MEGVLDGLDALLGVGIIHTGVFIASFLTLTGQKTYTAFSRPETEQHCSSQPSHFVANCQTARKEPIPDSRRVPTEWEEVCHGSVTAVTIRN